MQVDDHRVGPQPASALRVGQHAIGARDVHRPGLRCWEPVGVGGVGEIGDLDAPDFEEQRPALRGRGRKRAGVRDLRGLERLAGRVDPRLPLIEGVVRRRVARVPPGRPDSLRQRRRSVEDRVARRGRGRHRRLDVADGEVGVLHIRLELVELGREVVVPASAESERALPHGRMDQQVAADRDREARPLGPALSRRDIAGRHGIAGRHRAFTAPTRSDRHPGAQRRGGRERERGDVAAPKPGGRLAG